MTNKVTISKPLSWLWFNGKNVLPIWIKMQKQCLNPDRKNANVILKYPFGKRDNNSNWQPLELCRCAKNWKRPKKWAHITNERTNERMRDFYSHWQRFIFQQFKYRNKWCCWIFFTLLNIICANSCEILVQRFFKWL